MASNNPTAAVGAPPRGTAAPQPPAAPASPPQRQVTVDLLKQGITWAIAENGRIAVSWLEWELRGNEQASRMFKGADCALCRDSAWHVQKKRID